VKDAEALNEFYDEMKDLLAVENSGVLKELNRLQLQLEDDIWADCYRGILDSEADIKEEWTKI